MAKKLLYYFSMMFLFASPFIMVNGLEMNLQQVVLCTGFMIIYGGMLATSVEK